MRAVLPVVLLAALAWCAGQSGAARAEPSDVRTVVALGTSLTKDGGWLEALGQSLSACAAGPVHVANLGGSGKTSQWGREQIARVAAEKPDILLIEFAINDAHLVKGLSRARAAENIRAIVAGVRESRPGVRIILLSMNPVHGLRGWLRPRYDTYNDDYRALADGLGAEWIDMRPAWLASGRDLADAIPDGVHPVREAVREVVSIAFFLRLHLSVMRKPACLGY